MCGIVGMVSQKKIDSHVLNSMTELLYHRGPDDGGAVILNEGRVGLGNRRLKIIDLSPAGHQPMSLGDRYWITYNGEVYNFEDIRGELEMRGHAFRSRTDTEVVLHAYAEWGKECVQKFNGMFAFAIWDNIEGELFIARDRLGIKPLYYTTVGDTFLFSSEFKTFSSHPDFSRQVDEDSLVSLLFFLWIADPRTILKNVRSLPAANRLLYKNGIVKTERYWDLASFDRTDQHDVSEEEVFEKIATAVRRQMISDVPVGALLSGGLDSSAIVAFMNEHARDRVKTYTIVYKAEDLRHEAMENDAVYARLIAEKFNTDHKEIMIDPDVSELLPKLLWHLDNPVADPAVINTYLIAQAAREDGTLVLLTGAGGDEIFSGYRKHLATSLGLYYRKIPHFVRRRLIEPGVNMLPVAGEQKGYRMNRWLKRFVRNASDEPIQAFIGNYAYFTLEELNEAVIPALRTDMLNYSYVRHFEMFRRSAAMDFVNQMCYVDVNLFLPNLNLLYTDKGTMAASVEVRPPLLDHELVELAFRIPGRRKIRGLTQKYLFKKAMERVLPREVIYRPKAPFGAPLRSWTRKQLLPMINDLYTEESVKRRGIFHYPAIRRMIDANTSGREDHAHRLWCLLTIELWFRQAIDNNPIISRPASVPAINIMPVG